MARIQVENESVKHILEKNLSHLHDSLEEKGVQVEKFEVHVKKEGTQGNPFEKSFERQRGSSRTQAANCS